MTNTVKIPQIKSTQNFKTWRFSKLNPPQLEPSWPSNSTLWLPSSQLTPGQCVKNVQTQLERRRYKTSTLKFALWCFYCYLNPYSTNVPLLYPLKISKNRRFSDVFRGCRNRTLLKIGLNKFNTSLCCLHCWSWTCNCQLGTHINEKSEVSYYHSPNFSNNGDRKKSKIKSAGWCVGWSECSTVFFISIVIFCVSFNLS